MAGAHLFRAPAPAVIYLTPAQHTALRALEREPMFRHKNGWRQRGAIHRYALETMSTLCAHGFAIRNQVRGHAALCITPAGRDFINQGRRLR